MNKDKNPIRPVINTAQTFYKFLDKQSMSKIRVKSPEGKGVIDTNDREMPAIQITELGSVQVRVHFPEKGIWMKYNIGELTELLPKGFEINHSKPL